MPEKNKGGGAVSCMRVIPIDSVTPLGLPEVVSFLRFCPPTTDHRPVLITNVQLSVQVFNKKCFTFPPLCLHHWYRLCVACVLYGTPSLSAEIFLRITL